MSKPYWRTLSLDAACARTDLRESASMTLDIDCLVESASDAERPAGGIAAAHVCIAGPRAWADRRLQVLAAGT